MQIKIQLNHLVYLSSKNVVQETFKTSNTSENEDVVLFKAMSIIHVSTTCHNFHYKNNQSKCLLCSIEKSTFNWFFLQHLLVFIIWHKYFSHYLFVLMKNDGKRIVFIPWIPFRICNDQPLFQYQICVQQQNHELNKNSNVQNKSTTNWHNIMIELQLPTLLSPLPSPLVVATAAAREAVVIAPAAHKSLMIDKKCFLFLNFSLHSVPSYIFYRKLYNILLNIFYGNFNNKWNHQMQQNHYLNSYIKRSCHNGCLVCDLSTNSHCCHQRCSNDDDHDHHRNILFIVVDIFNIKCGIKYSSSSHSVVKSNTNTNLKLKHCWRTLSFMYILLFQRQCFTDDEFSDCEFFVQFNNIKNNFHQPMFAQNEHKHEHIECNRHQMKLQNPNIHHVIDNNISTLTTSNHKLKAKESNSDNCNLHQNHLNHHQHHHHHYNHHHEHQNHHQQQQQQKQQHHQQLPNERCTNQHFYRTTFRFNAIIILIILCIPIITASSVHNLRYSTNIVKTKYGPLRGILLRSNPTIEGYLGVPYATPPLGSLRYMPPVTPSTWKNTRLADHFSSVCPQTVPVADTGMEALLEMPRGRLAQLRRMKPLLANHSEDCLYLNMYVPREDDSGASMEKPIATVVYIHGESYEWNSGNLYDGTVLAAHGNVIVVTINFRLGVLGFLKTGTKGSAQGNFGLMDLVAGLHWLRENLPAFNGDPNKVTLMGHGTGAALANILIVSPVASDLVHRAILLSGSALSPWAIQKDPLSVKKRVAEHTGCHGDLLEDDLAPCLRKRPISELLAIKLDTPRFLAGFAPFVDGTVLVNAAVTPIAPLSIPSGSAVASTIGLELADFPTRELMFGLSSIESYLDLSAQDLEFGFNETRRDRILRTYVRNVYHFHLNEIFSALKNEYTDWERPPRNQLGSRDAALELLSDGHTVAPLIRLGYLHSLRGGKSYFMHFKHLSGERDFPQRFGTVRGEDVPFCLGLPLSSLFPYNYTQQDIRTSRILIHYLANFIQSGNPNGAATPLSKNTIELNSLKRMTSSIHHSENLPSPSLLLSSSATTSMSSSLHTTSTDVTYNASEEIVEIPLPPPILQQSKLIHHHASTNNRHRRALQKNTNIKLIKKYISKRNFPNNRMATKISEEMDEDDEEDNEMELDDTDDEENDDYEQQQLELHKTSTENSHDRLDEDNEDDLVKSMKLFVPYWDAYDTINQLFLELNTKPEMKNHYRGHKLSMWLSLIPQIHSPGESPDLSMRHHHFIEESAQFYDGTVRPQSLQRPPVIKISVPLTTATPTLKTEKTPLPIMPSLTTECPPNTTIVPTIAATRPHQNQDNNPSKNNNNNSFLKRLTNNHYQSYATALTVTIAVGCFLLLLNVFIFAAIYYQREKRATYTKKKEELTEAENMNSSSSPSIERYQQKNSRKSSLQSVSGQGGGVGGGGIGGVNGGGFGEYSCYEEKLHCKEKRALVDLCTVELPMQEYKFSPPCGSTTNSIRRSITPDNYNQSSQDNLILLPPSYASQSNVVDNNLVTYRSIMIPKTELCNQGTQSDSPPRVHDVSTTVDDNDQELSPDIPDPPPPPRGIFQGGILRQQTSGPATPGTTKKRVQIQEISV